VRHYKRCTTLKPISKELLADFDIAGESIMFGIANKKKNQEGAAAIEFAIVLPLLVLLLLGVIEFSVLFYDKAMITNASREGARLGIVYDYDSINNTNHPPDGEIITRIETYCMNYLISFGSTNDMSTEISRTGDSSGDILTVTVQYDYEFLVLPNFVSEMAGGITLEAETVMRME
jgi:hypothetical protein